MRDQLSDLIVEVALKDPRIVVLSGDHGYALFDAIRERSPQQFINVGVMEQAMVGIAAGLAKTGFLPIVYGLAAFVPIRVLEQIKLDVCYSNLPVVFLGDGAGLVYSTLGSSHQCAEDIACLRPLPNIRLYSPCDGYELKNVFFECLSSSSPCYIRIGKSDRPPLEASLDRSGTEPYFTNASKKRRTSCFVAIGSMVSIATSIAKEKEIPCISMPRLKPFPEKFTDMISDFNSLYVFEEHSRFGGATSAILDHLTTAGREVRIPKIKSYSLKEKFSDFCGSYQHALGEHGISDAQLVEEFSRLNNIL